MTFIFDFHIFHIYIEIFLFHRSWFVAQYLNLIVWIIHIVYLTEV